MTKKEIERKKALDDALNLFKDMTKTRANKYFTENIRFIEISKALMSAYIQTYAQDSDQFWIHNDFKKASYKEVPKKTVTVMTDAEGRPILKPNPKTGKIKPLVKHVPVATGETIEMFDLTGARKEFCKHFKITPKEPIFDAKPRRTTPKFDEFANVF